MASREIGSVFIRVQPDASGFRRDAQNQIRRQGPIEAEAEVDLDDSSLERQKRAAERRANRRPLVVDGEIDMDTRLRGIEEAQRELLEMSESARAARDELKEISRVMQGMREEMGELRLDVDRDAFHDLRRRIRELETELQLSTTDAEATLERFKATAEASEPAVSLKADVDEASLAAANAEMRAGTPAVAVKTRLDQRSLAQTLLGLRALAGAERIIPVRPRLHGMARVEAALLRMSRDRVIRLRTTLVGRGWQTIRGGLRSMAGLGDMDEMVQTFEMVTQRLDVLGTQVATMGTVIGSAANVATHALGGLLTTAADAGRALGLLAAAPTAILSAWAGFHVHRTIWGGFGEALEGYADALEKLPPNAQRAVKAIEALSEQVNDSVQDGFWATMNDEITRFAETVAPALERGMHRTAEIYASGLSGMLDLAQRWAESGQLGAAFRNINRMFEGVADGAVQAFDAFMTVGLRASALFPRLGHTIEQAMSGLNQWAQWASETGRIDRWIMQGVEATRQLLRATGALGGMVSGLTSAFRRAGIEGLPAFVDGLESARDLMQSPVWQFRMGNIFEGMAIGARATWEGVRAIADAFYDAHQWARELAIVIGEVSRAGLERFAQIFENPIFQRGSIDLFEGVRDSLETLRPAFDSLGNILGELGTLAGEIIREMAPGINTLMGMFSDLLTRLGPQLTQAVGPLTNFIDNLGHTMRWNVNNVIVPALSALLDIFNSLPPAIQRFIALGAVMSRWLPAVSTGFNRLVAGATTAEGRLRTLVTYLGSGATRNLAQARTAVRGLGREFRNLGTSLGTIARGGASGAAWFGGGALLMAPFVNQFADARREVSREMQNMRAAVATSGSAIRNILIGTVAGGLRTVQGMARATGRVLGSMFALMGGVPGVLLVGAITAIGTLRSRAAEAEQQIDSMFDALKEGGQEGLREELYSQLADEMQRLHDIGFDTASILDDLSAGRSLDSFIADFEKLATIAQNMQRGHHGQPLMDWDQIGITESDLALVEQYGFTLEELGGIGFEAFTGIIDGLRGAESAVEQVQAKMRAYEATMEGVADVTPRTAREARELAAEMEQQGKSLYDASDAAQEFSKAIGTLGDGRQSADARISAMGQAMRMMAGDYSDSADIVVESWNRTQNAMRTAEEAAQASGEIIGSAADGIATDYESMSERQVLAIQGAAELNEAAMGRAVDAYDRALAAGKSHSEAVEAAGEAYQSIGDDIEAFIAKAGMSESEAAAFRAEMERLQDVSDLEVVLQLTNLSEQDIQAAYDGLVELRRAGVDIDQSEWMAFIAANPDQALLSVANTEMALANFEAHEYMVQIAGDNWPALQAVAEAQGVGEGWEQGDYAAALTAIVDADGSMQAAIDAVWEWDQTQAEATFSSRDEVSTWLEGILPELADFEATRTATFRSEGADSLQSTLDTLNETLQTIASEVWGVSFENNASLTQDDANTLLSLLNDNFNAQWLAEILGIDNASEPARSAKRTLDASVRGPFQAAITAEDRASGVARTAGSNMDSVVARRRQAVISAVESGVGVVERALNWAARNRHSTIYVRTVQPRMSGGSVLNQSSSGLTFADGGIMSGGRVQRFADGGVSENHVAQISSPRTQYRVWAEPETGGEAYIPLAASKRARSLAIWKETGRRLNAFADGGIVGGQTYSQPAPTFNIVNNYPQAEPTSRTIQRAHEQLGVGGGDW